MFPYTAFTHSAATDYGLDCGPFAYSVSSSMTTEGGLKDPSDWLSLDEPNEEIHMDLQFLTEAYQDEEFTLTGSLVNYPGVTEESITITLKVYSLDCEDNDDEVIEYKVSFGEMYVYPEFKELPDDLLSKDISGSFLNGTSTKEEALPNFITYS